MMKQIVTIMIFFVWSIPIFASDTSIVFREIEYSNLFEIAKKENKAVMLYFHFDGCGACVTMERTTFRDKSVSDYYNANFVNYEINTRKGVGIEINKIYNIQMHPTFLFLDSSGNELHRIVGVFSPEVFLMHATNALLSNKTLSNYKKQYDAGYREPSFLFDYSYMLRDAFQLDSTIVNEYLDVIGETEYALEKNIRYIYEFCIHNFNVFIPFDNPRFNFLLQNRDKFYAYLDSNQVNTRIVWILNYSIYKAIEEQDDNTFKKAIELLKEFDNGDDYSFKESDGRVTGVVTSKNLVLSVMLYYYHKIGDHFNYQKTTDLYISKIWNVADELNNFAWNICTEATSGETEKLRIAIKCSVRSIELNDNYANNDTYAWLLYKSGKIKKASKQAVKAIEIAKKNNKDYSETQKLLDKIQEKKDKNNSL
jgi:thioredoxin-related protein